MKSYKTFFLKGRDIQKYYVKPNIVTDKYSLNVPKNHDRHKYPYSLPKNRES